jgi:hypothetical protein
MVADMKALTLADWKRRKDGTCQFCLYSLAAVSNGTLGYNLGRGAQPQGSKSGASLKELTKNLATLNLPSTVAR